MSDGLWQSADFFKILFCPPEIQLHINQLHSLKKALKKVLYPLPSNYVMMISPSFRTFHQMFAVALTCYWNILGILFNSLLCNKIKYGL